MDNLWKELLGLAVVLILKAVNDHFEIKSLRKEKLETDAQHKADINGIGNRLRAAEGELKEQLENVRHERYKGQLCIMALTAKEADRKWLVEQFLTR